MNDSKLKQLFGFARVPFRNVPKTLYADAARHQASDQIEAFLHRRGFAVVAGPPGCGKTALLGRLAAARNDANHQIAYIPFAMLNPSNMVRQLCTALGLQPKMSLAANLRVIESHLRDSAPVHPILIFDEVQQLSIDTARIIRIIAESQLDGKHRPSVIMAGGEPFIEQLRMQVYEPLRQRITLYLRLRPLISAEATREYIDHCMIDAGATQIIVDPAASQLIHDYSNGIPRLINGLITNAMAEALNAQRPIVTLEDIHAAAACTLLPERLPA